MKRHIVAAIRMALWYEAELAPARVSFAGGVVAGSLISLVCGYIVGFSRGAAVVSVVFSILSFIVMVFCAGALFKIGRKYGDKKPMVDILKEIERCDDNENTSK